MLTRWEVYRDIPISAGSESVHIGIHAGSVLEQDGQFFGAAINIASRTAAHARAGQILGTEAAIELVVDKSAIRYQALGKIQFKNIAEPISIFEIDAGHSALNMNVTDPVCRMQLKLECVEDLRPTRCIRPDGESRNARKRGPNPAKGGRPKSYF